MRIRHAKTRGSTIPGKEKSKGKDPEVGVTLIYWEQKGDPCILGVVSEGMSYVER